MDNNPFLEMSELNEVKLAPAHAISSLALNMALRWHDITIIKDGSMYQQKKLEGANIRLIDLPDVLETARQFELHILASPNRLSEALFDAVAAAITEESTGNESPEGEAPNA